jgi:hypothetical protein
MDIHRISNDKCLGLYRKREGQYACTSTASAICGGRGPNANSMELRGGVESCPRLRCRARHVTVRSEAGRMRKKIVSSVFEEREKDVRSEGKAQRYGARGKTLSNWRSLFMPQP